jgi:hypothetical protein
MKENLSDQMMSMLLSIKTGEFGISEFVVSLIFSFIAAIFIMGLYNFYSKNNFDSNESLGISFVIIAPSITSVFYAIQYSLPLSLGLLGALSFVRFRTPIKSPEDIGFILFIIAVSLLSAVFRFFAASILIMGMTLFVILKNYSIRPFFKRKGRHFSIFCTLKTKEVSMVCENINKLLKESGISNSDSIVVDISNSDDIANVHITFTSNPKMYKKSVLTSSYDVLSKISSISTFEVVRDAQVM